MEQEMFSKKTNKIYFKSMLTIALLTCCNNILFASEKFDYINYIKKLESFSSSFNQSTYDKDGSLMKKSSGKLFFKKKSMYRLEYTKPNKIKFISDGQILTTYDEDLEQVIIQRTSIDNRNNIVNFMTDTEYLKNKFKLDIYSSKGIDYVEFIPLSKDLENHFFIIALKDENIIKITFMNDFDQSVTMSFDDFKRNTGILDSIFKIDIPKNFDVIIDK
jgi:outer membrane lipoprotein carrier protein